MTAADPRQSTSPLLEAIEAHLASRDVARIIYGTIVGLAVVVALQEHPPAAGAVAATVAGTALAVGFAHLYGEFVATETRTRRPVEYAHFRTLAAESGAIVLGAGLPACFFVLAATGAMSTSTAFNTAKWSGAALICGYGFLAGRLSGAGRLRALGHGAALGAVGLALIGLKALLH